MHSQIKVSVVIPCYNVERYLEECINSVLNQKYNQIEIICVDNNSTDNTNKILQQIQKSVPLLIITNETRQGACFARNTGMEMATGEYLQFLDADDLLFPEKISTQVLILNTLSDKLPAVIVGESYREDVLKKRKVILSEKNDIWLGLLSTRLGNTCSNLWKKKDLQNVGGWNNYYSSSQEYELLFRLMKNNAKIAFDNNNNTLVRDRESGSISSSNLSGTWKQYCSLRAEIINYIIQNNINLSMHKKYFQVLFDSIRTLAKYDLQSAYYLFQKHIPSDFIPKKSSVTSNSYLFLYDIFGFQNSERIKAMFS
ncbi:MAG: glycosyltransferase family 2 protein [Bacteroidetes bacterium]|nr:glycosyltransferase family 2 protein [Bacteroidota bacterium]